ncbi:MAG: sigma 54-interacting transcriptional regulator [Gammaproteobacteria bacterium]|jgi:transcriptional regulator with PAS, ATPase and Fis domain|nr:sigma 54-interacting transcriptional regulator [Gammaproteobacteria bacterium]MBU1409052.1 sigma 54-interacting transcriptional regulator [Gammaproteobacteria bacterium]MBU1533527.1 sigma 54-interacting transcriptional regulator [Gammaproteobacteria bacterium]
MPQFELQELIDTNDQPFVVIDRDYRIVAANKRYGEAYGTTPAAIVGQHCYAVSHHSNRPCHENGEQCPHQALFETGEAVEVLHIHFHGDDQPERIRVRGHMLRGANGERYLGEQLFPLEADAGTDCDAMQMVGQSPAFLSCVDNLARVADSEASILLYGESGVGKELAARFIHARSARAGGAFIVINCAAVPETLFESELFGHERGAFSGSSGLKKGLFELADGGTLFLDEVAEIPLSLQAKLLRVLETGEFRRVGGTHTLKADVRLVSATNRKLLDEVDEKRFRLDLYYRLAGIDVNLPALRERREDLPGLTAFLLKRLAGARRACRLDAAALATLQAYDFPGNVRELRNLLQRAVLTCRDGVIRAADLHLPTVALPALSAAQPLAEVERTHIRALLDAHAGHRNRVATALGITERTLYRKLKRYGLN